jgi:uncharacterized membrane protein
LNFKAPQVRAFATAAIIAVWFVLYAWRAWIGHASLGTNAYDLSVFQYALSSLLHGGGGFVPFYGHSIFSDHAEPILWLFAPVYAVWPSPVLLLGLQLAATAAAGAVFMVWQRRLGIRPVLGLGLLVAFLFSRQTHSAVAAGFYPECLQAVLTFLLVIAWSAERRVWYWTALILFLMTKEDAAIYAAGFGIVQLLFSRERRTASLVTAGLAVVWFVLAIGVAVPAFRAAEGRPASSPQLDARFTSAEGRFAPRMLAERWVSRGTFDRTANLLSTAGFLPLAGAEWLLPAAAGIAINLAAAPDNQQASLMGHYAWPVLPWLFIAAATGALRLDRRAPHVAAVWVAALVLVTLATNPAVRRVWHATRDPTATVALDQLRGLTGRTILAQPNLIPHLPRTDRLFAIGGDFKPTDLPDLVLTTTTGNLWPLSEPDVEALVARYRADDRYEEIRSGPLFAFRLR